MFVCRIEPYSMSVSNTAVEKMFSKTLPLNTKFLEQILDKKGYKLLGTLGNGTYAKVK